MAERVLGITVSRHQGKMDFEKAYRAGARFALIRAGSVDSTTGKCYTDYQFERNAEIAPEIMPVGFWWFYRPQFSAAQQMNYFCELLKSVPWLMPPSLDVEIPGRGMAMSVKIALDAIEAYTARCPMIYTRGEFWNTNMGLVYWAKKYRLWIARYILGGSAKGAHPWKSSKGQVLPKVKPQGWEDWTFWQWSADGNGRGHEFGSPEKDGSASICLEWFNGSHQDLIALAADGWGKEQPPAPEPVMGWKESIDAWARTQGYTGPRP